MNEVIAFRGNEECWNEALVHMLDWGKVGNAETGLSEETSAK
jgi:hypothetical protein